jgi:hypothetical protein
MSEPSVPWAFQLPASRFIEQWVRHTPGDDADGLREACGFMDAASDPESVSQLLEFFDRDLPARPIFDHHFALLCSTTKIDSEIVWKRLCDHQWTRRCIRQFTLPELGLFFAGILELQCQEESKWREQLPGFWAHCAGDGDMERDRRRLLAGFALLAATAGRAMSAVRSLTSGAAAPEVKEAIELLRRLVETLRPHAPPWPAARLRELLAAL